MKITKLKGTTDLYGGNILKYRYIESTAREIAHNFGFKEIMTPIFERTELFSRGVGEGSDIVNKEMYTFSDRSDTSITLRPEGTASVTRAYVENKLYVNGNINKYFYFGPMFRSERPQAGRLRQFTQFGVEIFGNGSAYMDADVIYFGYQFLKKLGISKFKVIINTIGSQEGRAEYEKVLKEYFASKIDSMCADCKNRLSKNPLRILDCKVDGHTETIKNAPCIFDYLNAEDRKYFHDVTKYLTDMGVKYEVSDRLVRGLDYYTHTVFEFIYDDSDSDIDGLALLAGGRYNGLATQIDGPTTDAIGFASGIERLMLILDNDDLFIERADVCVITIGDKAKIEGLRLANFLRMLGKWVEIDYVSHNLKPQFRLSERINARYIVIVGEDEINSDIVKIKDTDKMTEEVVDITSICKYLNLEGDEKYAYKK